MAQQRRQASIRRTTSCMRWTGVDMLITAGFIAAEVPPEAVEYREAHEEWHREMFPGPATEGGDDAR